MGPYCKFCDNRCFTPVGIVGGRTAPKWVLRLYGTASIIATCPKGQAYEKEKLGICHDEIPWEQDGDVPEITHLRQELDFWKAAYDRLKIEVREWVCEKCRYIYPGPPSESFDCIICPRCKGTTMPKTTHERRRVERQRDALLDAAELVTEEDCSCERGDHGIPSHTCFVCSMRRAVAIAEDRLEEYEDTL